MGTLHCGLVSVSSSPFSVLDNQMQFLFERIVQCMLLGPPFPGKWPLLGLATLPVFRLPSLPVLSLRRGGAATGCQPTSPAARVLCRALTLATAVMGHSQSQEYLQCWQHLQRSCRSLKQGHSWVLLLLSRAGNLVHFYLNFLSQKPENPGNHLNQSHKELAGKETDSPQSPKDGCFLIRFG